MRLLTYRLRSTDEALAHSVFLDITVTTDKRLLELVTTPNQYVCSKDPVV